MCANRLDVIKLFLRIDSRVVFARPAPVCCWLTQQNHVSQHQRQFLDLVASHLRHAIIGEAIPSHRDLLASDDGTPVWQSHTVQ